MCKEKLCEGDYCCEKDCTYFGGPRSCPTTRSTGAYRLQSVGKWCNPQKGILWQGVDQMCETRCDHVPGCVYYTVYANGWCQISNTCMEQASQDPVATIHVKIDVTRVLFVGNSFTYVNDLPYQLMTVAASLGRTVEAEGSTIGGCTLYRQEACHDERTAELMDNRTWDYIVLQEYSILPALNITRQTYFYPAISDFVSQKKKAKIVMYQTWGYHDGYPSLCFDETYQPDCWPFGGLRELLQPACEANASSHINSFPCMGYALARAYFSALRFGADMVFPAGLAWMAAQGVREVPANCKAAIDMEYAEPFELNLLPPADELRGLSMYLIVGGGYDKHQTKIAQYLNALTLYATLFQESPEGASPPDCRDNCFGNDWTSQPGPMENTPSAAILLKLQQVAAQVVSYCGRACSPAWQVKA